MSVTNAPEITRQRNGVDLPLPGTYALDKAHTTVEFVARHLMISKVRGRFENFDGTFTIGEVPEDSHVEVTIDAASVSTKEGQRDEHLRSGDFFDVEHYPTWSFKSTKVEDEGDGIWKVTGDLTIRGVTNSVALAVEFEGAGSTPWGTTAVGFSAIAEIDREKWGMTFNQALETGGVLVGKKVNIEISLEANPVA